MHNYPNTDFGFFIAPLMRPVYVLQMARSKRWSAQSRLKAIGKLRRACIEVINLIDKAMDQLVHEANEEEEAKYPRPTKNATDQKADDIMADRLDQTGRY